MSKSQTTAPIANISEVHSETKSTILELLPQVQHIGTELECKMYTKNHLIGMLSEAIEKLPNEQQHNLSNLLWQIVTIDGVLSECITPKDFCNLEDFIYYTKELVTLNTL